MADHEDYQEGEAPAAHKVSHQDGGADEISVAGLSGTTEDLAAHILLPTVHQDAPTLIENHRLVAGAHHAKYTNGEAVTAMGAKADANPLPHDKAAEWGATEHTAIADAAPHHAKYTNANAVTAMGAKADANPLHHDKAAEWGATEHTAIGDAAPHHAKYTNAEAVAALYAANPCFIAHLTSTVFNVTGDGTVYHATGAIWTEIIDQGSNFSNGTFTAPETGVYLLTASFAIIGILAAHTRGYVLIYAGEVAKYIALFNPVNMAAAGGCYLNGCSHCKLVKDETAEIWFVVENGTKVVDLTFNSYFTGSRII